MHDNNFERCSKEKKTQKAYSELSVSVEVAEKLSTLLKYNITILAGHPSSIEVRLAA